MNSQSLKDFVKLGRGPESLQMLHGFQWSAVGREKIKRGEGKEGEMDEKSLSFLASPVEMFLKGFGRKQVFFPLVFGMASDTTASESDEATY